MDSSVMITEAEMKVISRLNRKLLLMPVMCDIGHVHVQNETNANYPYGGCYPDL